MWGLIGGEGGTRPVHPLLPPLLPRAARLASHRRALPRAAGPERRGRGGGHPPPRIASDLAAGLRAERAEPFAASARCNPRAAARPPCCPGRSWATRPAAAACGRRRCAQRKRTARGGGSGSVRRHSARGILSCVLRSSPEAQRAQRGTRRDAVGARAERAHAQTQECVDREGGREGGREERRGSPAATRCAAWRAPGAAAWCASCGAMSAHTSCPSTGRGHQHA